MKSQPKSPLAQLNLPLLDLVPMALPDDKDAQLVQALVELLLSAAIQTPTAEGGAQHEPETNH
jgi:hypothetical protein